ISYARSEGLYARGFPLIGTDIVEEICGLAEKMFTEYPNCIFFGGRIVFKEETILSRVLYNYVTFAVQRRLHQLGIPFVIVPVPVSGDLVPKGRPSLAKAEITYGASPSGSASSTQAPSPTPR
ncbi:MAG TPA: hypothetical protein VFB30_17585, partial [Spirochaetia bacterium]|nr:hypothetical protein [Spirochaetia bacterium]